MELDKAKQYIDDVLSGKELVCQYTRQAVERHVKDLKRKDIYFDEEEAEKVLKFFPFVKHYKGAWAGKDFILEPYQCFIVSSIFGWKNLDGTRRFRKATIEIPRKSGKELCLNTLIPTPYNGFTTMGELKEGDIVFGGDGKPCKVLFKSDIDYTPQSFDITFSNGQLVRAGADHQWQLSDYGEKKIFTTKQLFDGVKFPYMIECADSTLTKIGEFHTSYGFNYVAINRIVPCKSVPMQCIEVDSSDNTYLIGKTFVRTHNTTIAAGIGLYMFVADGEAGAEVYTGATTRDQAKICFTDARQMALVSKPISSRAEVLTKNMSIVPTASKFEYVSSDYDTLDGLNPHLAILDEVHAYKTGGLYDIFISAMGARTQPLLLIITTAGFRKEWWYYKSQRKGIIDILSGRVQDDTTFGIIYTLDEGDDWKDPKVWKKANPSLGVNIKESYLRQRVNDALIRPSETVNVMTKHFNVWTDAAKIWIPKPKWNSFYTKEPDLKGLQCFGGVDLSYVRDITAYTLCFLLPNGKKYLKHRFFVPLDSANDREQATGIPYAQWIREGHLIANDGNTIDYNNVKKYIIDDLNQYNIHTIGFDKANASHIMQEINDEVSPLHLNIDGKWQFINRVYGISPHVKTISPPTKEFERMVFCDDPEILHDGNPVMEWMIGNVVIKSNSEGDIRPDKEKSEEKIDGVMSTILSIEQLLYWSKLDTKPKSKYEEEDLTMF